jgi:hypothetical protein
VDILTRPSHNPLPPRPQLGMRSNRSLTFLMMGMSLDSSPNPPTAPAGPLANGMARRAGFRRNPEAARWRLSSSISSIPSIPVGPFSPLRVRPGSCPDTVGWDSIGREGMVSTSPCMHRAVCCVADPGATWLVAVCRLP